MRLLCSAAILQCCPVPRFGKVRIHSVRWVYNLFLSDSARYLLYTFFVSVLLYSTQHLLYIFANYLFYPSHFGEAAAAAAASARARRGGRRRQPHQEPARRIVHVPCFIMHGPWAMGRPMDAVIL